MIIVLPYPNKELMPNRKNGKHWAATVSVKNNAYSDAFYATKEKIKHKVPNEKMAITITFVQSDKRHRDLDNLLAASKSMLDGVATAIGIDDKLFEPITIKRGYDKVAFTILELEL
jgi:crossover junction endodeoxyribonuclease RusA